MIKRCIAVPLLLCNKDHKLNIIRYLQPWTSNKNTYKQLYFTRISLFRGHASFTNCRGCINSLVPCRHENIHLSTGYNPDRCYLRRIQYQQGALVFFFWRKPRSVSFVYNRGSDSCNVFDYEWNLSSPTVQYIGPFNRVNFNDGKSATEKKKCRWDHERSGERCMYRGMDLHGMDGAKSA